MSSASQFIGGGIKSIQRGVFNNSGGASATATVSSVDTSKAELRPLGVYQAGSSAAFGGVAILTNSTTITFTTGAAANLNIGWELVEHY